MASRLFPAAVSDDVRQRLFAAKLSGRKNHQLCTLVHIDEEKVAALWNWRITGKVDEATFFEPDRICCRLRDRVASRVVELELLGSN